MERGEGGRERRQNVPVLDRTEGGGMWAPRIDVRTPKGSLIREARRNGNPSADRGLPYTRAVFLKFTAVNLRIGFNAIKAYWRSPFAPLILTQI